eukprot:scaffold6349_cov115-Isochrysis_galbana.AAC.3
MANRGAAVPRHRAQSPRALPLRALPPRARPPGTLIGASGAYPPSRLSPARPPLRPPISRPAGHRRRSYGVPPLHVEPRSFRVCVLPVHLCRLGHLSRRSSTHHPIARHLHPQIQDLGPRLSGRAAGPGRARPAAGAAVPEPPASAASVPQRLPARHPALRLRTCTEALARVGRTHRPRQTPQRGSRRRCRTLPARPSWPAPRRRAAMDLPILPSSRICRTALRSRPKKAQLACRPVSSATREGVQSGDGVCASSRRRPDAASASRAGVTPRGDP